MGPILQGLKKPINDKYENTVKDILVYKLIKNEIIRK
ncbi:MAG: hypothetical protein ACFS24_01205 [Candidatus Karelsulcia muelleri]